MSDSTLSQEEIDALLGGGSSSPSPASSEASSGGGADYSSLAPLFKEAMDSAGTVAGTLLSKEVTVQDPAIAATTPDGFSTGLSEKSVLFDAALSGGVSGKMAVVLTGDTAAKIADLMMGGDASAPPAEMDDLYLSAVGEAISQMIGAACNILSKGRDGINPTPPEVKIIQSGDDLSDRLGASGVVDISFPATISDLGDTTIHIVVEEAIAKTLAGVSEEPEPAPAPSPQPQAAQAQAAPPPQPGVAAPPSPAMVQAPVSVQPVQFESLGQTPAQSMPTNIDLLMDVPLHMTVELGRASMMVRDVLQLGNGSIIELDKLAGEPVDLLVNGKLIARAEVVVIDENFGVRVTDIISPIERMKNLQ